MVSCIPIQRGVEDIATASPEFTRLGCQSILVAACAHMQDSACLKAFACYLDNHH